MLKSIRFLLIAALLLSALGASIVSAQILNSERIEQTFGSYGIDVLFSDETLRLSNLYSEHDGERVTRTFAIVDYPDEVSEAFAAEHRQILDGGSIGATFKVAGWEVIKTNVYVGALREQDALSVLMGTELDAEFAIHLYKLGIVRDDERYEYATIVEMHHPDYLNQAQLIRIYLPEGGVGNQTESMRVYWPMVFSGLRQLQELGLALSQ